MRKVWSIERFTYFNSMKAQTEIWLAVHAPYSPQWRLTAIDIGGKWKNPRAGIEAWNFRLPAASDEPKIRAQLEELLDKIYPDQDVKDKKVPVPTNGHATVNSTITLERDDAAIPPMRAPASTNGTTEVPPLTDKDLAIKIAKVVTGIVIRDVTAKNAEFEARITDDLSRTTGNVSAAIEAVNKKLDSVIRPIQIIIKNRDGSEEHRPTIDNPHKKFPQLLRVSNALSAERRNIWLMGPTGSGKTTVAKQLADALGVPFFFNGAIDTEYKLSGFIDANGRVISTAFRKAAESDIGAVFLFDECDRSMVSALLAFQAHLAQGWFNFPDKVIYRHPKLVILATGNTWGFGGDVNYVGASKIDYAFLNRFAAKIKWDYDELQEERIATDIGRSIDPDKGYAIGIRWTRVVQDTRRLMRENAASMIISPRITYAGVELLADGMPKDEVVELTFGEYMGHDKWRTVGRVATAFANEAT